jgi:hypothetical protein
MKPQATFSPGWRAWFRVVLLGFVLSVLHAGAFAVVTTTADSGPGSLRQVIADAPTGATIVFDPALSGGTIALTSPITIDKHVVVGSAHLPAGLTLSGGGTSRIFNVTAAGRLELYQITLRDGRAPNGANGQFGQDAGTFSPSTPGQPGSSGGNGGAIFNQGELHLEGCTFHLNRAGNGGAGGRGGNGSSIASPPSGGGAGGSGGAGGAIFNSGSATIIHCTFSGNFAGNGGPGGDGGFSISGFRTTGGTGGSGGNGGAIAGTGTTNLQWSTCTLNQAGSGAAGGLAGGIGGASGRGGALHGNGLTLRNSLIAGNAVPDAGEGRDVSATAVVSLGHNLVGASNGSSGWSAGTGDLVGTNATPIDPQLGSLANTGGKTPTHEPAPASPAVNAAQPGVDGLDQRGLPRRSGGRPDIGSVEYQYPPVLHVSLPGAGQVNNGQTYDFGLLNIGDSVSVTFVLENIGENPLADLSATVIGEDPEIFPVTGPTVNSLITGQTTTVRIDFALAGVGPKSATLRITSNDAANSPFDIHLTGQVNAPPSAISLDSRRVFENSEPGTVVGTLQVTDPNEGDTVTLSVDSVFPLGNDGVFTVVGNELRVQLTPDYESLSGYLVTIRATDSRGLSSFGQFPIRVEDVDEPPVLDIIADVTRPYGAPPVAVGLTAFDRELPNRMTIDAPAIAAGEYAMSVSNFSPPFPVDGLAVELVAANPPLGTTAPNLPLLNAADCAGNAVLFDRGVYSFHHKFKNAEASGANAAIILQSITENLPSTLLSSTGLSTLPGGMVSHYDGRVLVAAAGEGPVTGTIRPFPAGMNLTITSDNPSLLPNSGINLQRVSATGYSMLLTPIEGAHGTANITVRADDLTGNETTRQFAFSVAAPVLTGSSGPGGVPLEGGSVLDFGGVVLGESASITVTIRNQQTEAISLGGLAIQGDDASLFSVAGDPLPASLEPDTETSFTVTYQPLASGPHGATLKVESPTGVNLLQFSLSGRGLSAMEDTDGDGLNDAAERKLSGLGYDWQVAQPELVATLMDSANVAGLFRQDQIQALNVGTPLIQRDANGKVLLRLRVEKSTNLGGFQPLDFSGGQWTPNPTEGRIDIEFTSEDDAAFFRVGAE